MKTTPIRLALAVNLTFSTLCAVALCLGGSSIAQVLGTIPAWILTGLGVGLLGFAGFIAFVFIRFRLGLALVISTLDLLWVVSTLPLIAVPNLLTTEGKIVVLLVACIVGLLGLLQLRGIWSALTPERDKSDVFRLCFRLDSAATPNALWAAIRDLGAIATYSVGLRSSHLEGGATVVPGTVRVCANHQNQTWAEEVVSFDDEARHLVLRFKTEAENFPFPFEDMVGGWSVTPGQNGGAAVDVWWSIKPKMRRFGWVLVALMSIPLDRDLRRILAAMDAGGHEQSKGNSARLPMLSYC